MRKILFIFLCLPFLLGANQDSDSTSVSDGTTTIWNPWQTTFSGATVSNDGDGSATVTITGGSGDSVTVNSTAIDTTANIKDTTDITWTITDGGAGGPDDVNGAVVSAITRDAEWDTISEINTASTDADILIFQNIAVSGQDTVVTDAVADTLTLAGGGITSITTNATTDTITFTSTEVDGSTTNELPTAGTAIDVSGAEVSVDLTELNTVTFGSGTFTTLVFDAGVTDPTFTMGSNSIAITNASTFTNAGNAILDAATSFAGDVTGTAGATVVGNDSHSHGASTITEADPLALLTAGTDNVKDTHIDWGTGASQVSADDIPDGSTNAIITLTQETNFETAYTHSQDNTQAHSDYMLNSGDIATGTYDFGGATVEIPNGATDAALANAGEAHLNTTDEQLSFHSAADGEISGEVSISLLYHIAVIFDPDAICDGAVDRVFLGTIGDDFPEGLTIDEWKLSFEADPTTEVDLDLKYADAFIGVANATVMDVLDTTNGASSEDTDANINAGAVVANGKVLYLEFGTAYTETGHQIIFELFFHGEED